MPHNHQKNAEGDEVAADSSMETFLSGCPRHCIPSVVLLVSEINQMC
jgi:hypothetical protein